MKEKLCLLLRKSGIKAKVLVITSLILTITVLGTTYAFKSHNSQLTNLLKAHKVSGGIIENGGSPEGGEGDFTFTPGGNTTKKVQFENTGDAAVFLRVAYAQTWLDKDGELLAHGPSAPDPSYATPNWTGNWTSEWFYGDDGWYYYKKVLKAGDITDEVLDSVGFLNTPALPDEYATGKYELTFIMEIVQCSDEAKVNEDALSKTFGKKATISEISIEKGAVTGGTVTWGN